MTTRIIDQKPNDTQLSSFMALWSVIMSGPTTPPMTWKSNHDAEVESFCRIRSRFLSGYRIAISMRAVPAYPRYTASSQPGR
jgi:hypothetical protein